TRNGHRDLSGRHPFSRFTPAPGCFGLAQIAGSAGFPDMAYPYRHMSKEVYTLPVSRRLEAESIHILREVVSDCARPVMMYSVGKDSSVLLRLAQKAFYPGKIPFPLLHIDTAYKFPEMYEFRDRCCREAEVELRVHRNEA